MKVKNELRLERKVCHIEELRPHPEGSGEP